MIGGDDAAAEARVGVFQRGGSFTSIQTEPKVLKAGWLRRASEADAEEGEHAEWCTRYFRLVSWWRDGAQQAELEYYLDAELTPRSGPALPNARRGRLLLQIHDELIFEVEERYAPELRARVRLAMTDESGVHGAGTLRVPLRVQLKQGRSWGELEVVEDIEAHTQM